MGNPLTVTKKDGTIPVRVLKAPLIHQASGFQAWDPGDYEFPRNPDFDGWLKGQVERGAMELVEVEPEPAKQPAARKP